MTEQPETSATYEVHGIDEEPTLTWTPVAAPADDQAGSDRVDEPDDAA